MAATCKAGAGLAASRRRCIVVLERDVVVDGDQREQALIAVAEAELGVEVRFGLDLAGGVAEDVDAKAAVGPVGAVAVDLDRLNARNVEGGRLGGVIGAGDEAG